MSVEEPRFGIIAQREFFSIEEEGDGIWGRTPPQEMIGLFRSQFLGYKEVYGFNLEEVERELGDCAQALRLKGYEHLVPLLDREVETGFLRGVKEGLIEIVGKSGLHPQPLEKITLQETGLTPKIVREVEKSEVEWQMEEKIRRLGFRVPFKIVPPEKLWGICGRDRFGNLELTDIGRAVVLINKRFPWLSLFLIGGIAREALGIKPRVKRRRYLPSSSFKINEVFRCLAYNVARIQLPPADIDFLAVSATGKPGLDEIKRLLGEIFKEGLGGKVWIKVSSQRQGLKTLKFGTRRYYEYWEEESGSLRRTLREEFKLGELFYPPYLGNYSSENRLLPFLMLQSRTDIAILLVPYYHSKEKKTLVWGVALDFFDGLKDNRRENRIYWERHFLWPSYFPFPEIAFPIASPPDCLWRLRYLLRTLAWENRLPVMHSVARERLDDQLDPGTIRRFLAKETQEYLTEEVIYPLAEIARNRPELLGTEGQRIKMATALVKEDLPLAFNGDPFVTVLRCLPAGMTYRKRLPPPEVLEIFEEKRAFPLIYGWGVFDERGLFPAMGKFLKKENRADLLISRMEKCPHGGVREGRTTGWREFLNFLFEQTRYEENKARSVQRVAELLTPVFYPGDWKSFIRDCLIEVDERFAEISRKSTYRQRLLSILATATEPLTTAEMARLVGAKPSVVFFALTQMEEKKEVVRLGGRRREWGSGSGLLGGGGWRVAWISPSFYQENVLVDPLRFIRYFSPIRRVLTILAAENGKNRDQLREATGLKNVSVLAGALDLLLKQGAIEVQMEKRKGDSRPRAYYYLKKELEPSRE